MNIEGLTAGLRLGSDGIWYASLRIEVGGIREGRRVPMGASCLVVASARS